MAKWNVYAIYTGSKHLGVVEADTKEEAEDAAWELDTHVSMCHQCAHEIELNTDPTEIQAEEVRP